MKQEPAVITVLRKKLGDSVQIGDKHKSMRFIEVTLDGLNPRSFFSWDTTVFEIRYVPDSRGNVIFKNTFKTRGRTKITR